MSNKFEHTYCLVCRKKTKNDDPQVVKTKKPNVFALKSICDNCGKRKSRLLSADDARMLYDKIKNE